MKKFFLAIAILAVVGIAQAGSTTRCYTDYNGGFICHTY
jgi:hypothetical protein